MPSKLTIESQHATPPSVAPLITRRRVLAGTAGFVLGSIGYYYSIHSELFQDSSLRLRLNSVWNEVNELQHPPTHQDLLDNVYNPFSPIQITGEELESTAIVDDEDSEGLPDGLRKNSYGPDQPNSWPILAAADLTTGARSLGRTGIVKAYNFAQPGAGSPGLDGFENPEGNVQLGAKTREDMNTDHPGEPTPTEVMENHKGLLLAACGLHGDDMRDTADLLLQYIDPESDSYNVAFADFIENPTKEKLKNDTVINILIEVLTSYKNDKNRIKTKFQEALNDYEKINNNRLKTGMGRMVLMVSQPPALDEYETIPYTKLGSKRGVTGTLNVRRFGNAGHLAALLVMTPFYLLEGPLLKEFSQRTGIPVTSTPLLAMQIPKDHLAPDSHYNALGQRDRANTIVHLVEVTDGSTSLTFAKDGTPQTRAA